ncbi:hypothetical protein [Planktotalea sp.]|uniref:hypothetical protein n=1 Tax=Planktotalea sp. TaxID=2029877 RepID=UPI003296D033
MNSLTSFFEPSPTLLAFLLIKTFFYVEFVGALALIRSNSAKGPSRIAAILALLVALIGVAAKYLPALEGFADTDAGLFASTLVHQGVLNEGSGMALPFAVSTLFGLSCVLKGRRWWVLDVIFAIAACAFFGLWIYTLV